MAARSFRSEAEKKAYMEGASDALRLCTNFIKALLYGKQIKPTSSELRLEFQRFALRLYSRTLRL